MLCRVPAKTRQKLCSHFLGLSAKKNIRKTKKTIFKNKKKKKFDSGRTPTSQRQSTSTFLARWDIFPRALQPVRFEPRTLACIPSSNHYTTLIFMSNYVTSFVILYLACIKITIWGLKLFQIKKFWTTKFHNFSRSTTLMLWVFPSEVICKIWI